MAILRLGVRSIARTRTTGVEKEWTMSKSRRCSRWASTLAATAALDAAVLSGSGEAAVGEVLRTTALPSAANCNSDGTDFGTALTVVPGGKAGFPGVPILAVTSCVSTASKLFFLDASTNPATLKTSVTTSLVRWDALSYRPDKGDLLGCHQTVDGATFTSLYAIHFSPFDPVATGGIATFLVSGPSGSTCAGIAWDPKDKTIYQASTNVAAGGSRAVLRYSPPNTETVTSIPSGCAGPVAGVGIAGVSLFVACEAVTPIDGTPIPASIRQLDKANGTSVRVLGGPSIPAAASGVPDDPGPFVGYPRRLRASGRPVRTERRRSACVSGGVRPGDRRRAGRGR
jgi:hypothetical protein